MKGARNAASSTKFLLIFQISLMSVRVELLQASFFITLFWSLKWCHLMLQEYLPSAMKAQVYSFTSIFLWLCAKIQ